MATALKDRIIRDKPFADRLARACDGNPNVPEYNRGRLTWVVNKLVEQFGQSVSIETVRKWFAGETKPRPDKLAQLAQLLEVDEAWLSLGTEPDLQPRERKLRNAAVDGAVNVLAGFIQMDGGHPAFPADRDKRAEQNHIDLYAIIKGAQYAFHVVLAKDEGEVQRFVVPTNYDQVFIVAMVRAKDLAVRCYELPAEYIEKNGARRGGAVEVVIADVEGKLRGIRNFGERL